MIFHANVDLLFVPTDLVLKDGIKKFADTFDSIKDDRIVRTTFSSLGNDLVLDDNDYSKDLNTDSFLGLISNTTGVVGEAKERASYFIANDLMPKVFGDKLFGSYDYTLFALISTKKGWVLIPSLDMFDIDFARVADEKLNTDVVGFLNKFNSKGSTILNAFEEREKFRKEKHKISSTGGSDARQK